MGWTERHDGVPATGDLAGNPAFAVLLATIQRRFIVTTDVPPDVLIASPHTFLGGDDGATPLPSYGTSHPRFPGAVLRSYTAVGNPPNLDVTALYRYGDIDPLAEEFYSQSGDWFDETDKIPNAVKRVKVVTPGGEIPPGGGPPLPPVTIEPWDFDAPPIEVLYTSRQLSRSVNIGGYIADAIAAMDKQNNRLHEIGGRIYRFKAGGYNEVRKNVWVVNYHWFYDSGTAYDNSLDVFYNASSRLALPPPVQGQAPPSNEHPGAVTALGRGDTQYLRLPYHKRLIQEAASGDPLDRPTFPHFLPYVIDLNGWEELVGI